MAAPSTRKPDWLSADGMYPRLGQAWTFIDPWDGPETYEYTEITIDRIDDLSVSTKELKTRLQLSDVYLTESGAKLEKAARLDRRGRELLRRAKAIRSDLLGLERYRGEANPKPLYRGEQEKEDASPHQGDSDGE